MAYVVTNCFHWIGYHVVIHLLDQGHMVVGLDTISSDKKEMLSMFLGRNDLFSLNPNKLNEEPYDTTILVDDFTPSQPIQSKRTVQLSYDTTNVEDKTSTTTIRLPLLFGEWMEMIKEGFYYENKYIRFDSELFLKEAIYIDDFIQCMMQSLKSAYLPTYFEIKSSGNKKMNGVDLEKSIYVRDNKPIRENLKIVQAHYNKFRDRY